MFTFTPHNEIAIDGRPLGRAIHGAYGWVAQDLNGSIVGHQLDSKEDAACALFGIDGPQAKREKAESYAKSKSDPYDAAWGYDR
jgi:hypothetical protein